MLNCHQQKLFALAESETHYLTAFLNLFHLLSYYHKNFAAKSHIKHRKLSRVSEKNVNKKSMTDVI